MNQNLERHFAEQSGFTTFTVKNAHHGVIAGTVPCETIEAIRTEIEQFTPLDSVAALTLFVPEKKEKKGVREKKGGEKKGVRNLLGEKKGEKKGVRNLLCEAPFGPFRQKVPDTFFLPALTCVAQPACEPDRIAFEAYITRGKDVSFDRDRSNNTVSVRHDGLTWLHCGQTVAPMPSEVYAGSLEMFHQAQATLVQAGSHFNQVVRTWLYQGDIVGHEGQTIRYHELNRARSDFFEHDAHAVAPYPASTGIGQLGTGITMNCLALTSDHLDAFRNMALENPLQTSAFDYEEKYGRKSPKFSRAMVTQFDRQAIVWISGTASITDSETRHPGDVAAQTRQTLENIRALISPENLGKKGSGKKGSDTFCAKHPPGRSGKRCLTPFSPLDNLASVRIYIKNRSDYPVVRSLCEEHLGRTPATYVIADICRKDLLVEIEAIAYCS